MQRNITILLLTLLMASCHHAAVETQNLASQPTSVETHHGASLQAIDSLMWQQPDSALAVMVQFAASPKADSLDEFDRHYCQLLISELLYKNDYGQTNRKALLEAVDYFDTLCCRRDAKSCVSTRQRRDAPWCVSTANTNVFLDARAHYIKGVGFYERDSLVEACAEYLKTLEIMEGWFEEKELVKNKAKFMTYSYGRLAELFSDQYMMENSIICYEKSLHYCQIATTSPFGVSRILYQIGKQNAMLRRYEPALYYFKKAVEQLPDTNNVTYRSIQSHIALCNYNLGLGWKQPIEALQQLYDKTTESECAVYALFIGSIYADEHFYDSALVYLETLFEEYGEIEAAKYLRVIYDSLGYHEKGNACRRFLADHIPSEGDNKALVSQLSNLFQQYLNQKQERQAEQENREIVTKIMKWIVPGVSFFAFVIIIAMRKRHKRKIKAQQQLHQAQQEALSGRLKRKNQEVQELKGQIRQQNDLDAKTEVASSFAEEPVCQLILERVKEGQFKSKMGSSAYKDYALDKQQMLELCLAADRHFGNFTIRLKENYPALTQGDLDYCCLYLLGLTDADVAALMQRAYNTVIERRGKLQKIFGCKSSLSITLMGIAKNLHTFD